MNSEWQSLPPQTQQELKNTMNAMQPPQSVEEVKATLETTEKGGVRQSIRNCLTVFQRDPVLAGAIAYNILTDRKDIIKPIGFHRESTALTDTDMKYLLLYLEETYLLNEQTYLHLRENLAGVGYEVFDKNSPLPVEEGQIPREALGKTQRRIETARAYYLAEHQDEPVGKIQNVAVTTLEKFRSGVRKRRNLAPRSLPENDVRFIDPMYNELFRVPDGGVVQMTYPDGHQRSEKVEYLDDYHMKIGSSVQHICEFAERMARSRAIVEPEPLTQQDCRAWNLEYDYYLTVQADNGSWNYALYQGDCCLLERGKIDAPELMIEEVRDEIMYTHNLRNKDCIPLTQEEFTQKLADRNEIQSYRMKQFQQSGHDCYLVMQLQQDADPALRFAAMRYLEKKNIAPSIENYEILYRGNLPEGKRSVPQAELLEHLYQ